jgi:hypothetical protein
MQKNIFSHFKNGKTNPGYIFHLTKGFRREITSPRPALGQADFLLLIPYFHSCILGKI